VTTRSAPARDDVVSMLATYGERTPEQVRDQIDSLELAWLIHQVEQRYGVVLDLDDDLLMRMTSVDGAVTVLAEALAERAGD
jgi:acyl carrier protein